MALSFTKSQPRSRYTPEAAAPANGRAKKERRKETPKETFWFWVRTIAIVLVIQTFLVQPFRIPSPSMERTLLVGDFLLVSKLHWGARTPSTLGIPFTPVYLPGLTLPHTRLPGFTEPQRGDVAVFNFPPEEGPVQRRTPYIKRLVAMPGDSVALVGKVLRVNGAAQPFQPTFMQTWAVHPAEGSGLPRTRLEEAGAEYVGMAENPTRIVVHATEEGAERLRQLGYVARVEPFVYPAEAVERNIFPAGAAKNRDQWGPVQVPAAGMTVPLNAETWPLYRDVVVRYEGHAARLLPTGEVEVDGRVVDAYTVEQDYYFAMGDNRDNSLDSRFWGFVPHDHLVGKAFLVFMSIDFDRFLPRLNRFFRPIS